MFIDDRKDNSVPDSFPGNVKLVMDARKEVSLIQESYRKDNTPEFEYSITALLPKVGHQRIKFDRKNDRC